MQTNTYPQSFLYDNIEKTNDSRYQLQPGIETAMPCVEKWKSLVPFLDQISSQHSLLVLLWDIVTNHFVYTVDKRNVAGYEACRFLADDGIKFSLSNIHPDFLESGLIMQRKAFEYIFNSEEEEVDKIVVNFDGLYKKCNGEYMHFLQQVACIEFDSNRHPLLFRNYILDITHLKKERTANLVITGPHDLQIWNYNFSKHRLEARQAPSKQENKILCCLAKGKSSKEIGEELFISPHTADTHRRNLLEITNCLNTTGLVTYAKLVGLL